MKTFYPGGLFERVGVFIWKMQHHDEIITSLEIDLEEAEEEICRLKTQIAKLEKKNEELKRND